MALTNQKEVKKYARALIDEGRSTKPNSYKTSQIGEDFMKLVERHVREFIEQQVELQRRQKRLGDPLADLTPGQRAAMKPVKRKRKRI